MTGTSSGVKRDNSFRLNRNICKQALKVNLAFSAASLEVIGSWVLLTGLLI